LSYLATTSQTTGRIAPEQRSASHRNAGRHQIGTPVGITPEQRSASPGIRTQLRENVFDTVSGRHLLIPQGTRLVGEYDSKVAYGQERALVVWTRLILPNGNSINLEGMPGIDLSGYAGLEDKVMRRPMGKNQLKVLW